MSQSLKEYLEICKAAYYAGEPIISDDQYDHLEELCQEDLSIGTNKGRVRHWYRMYSLQKFYKGDKLPNFSSIRVTPKLDGAAVALRYLDGKLDSVVTRGNGTYGEDITHLFEDWGMCEIMRTHKEIPLKGAVQITGEIVAPSYIENARNYAAGALGLKSKVLFYDKILAFFAYDAQPTQFNTYGELLNALYNSCDFNVVGRYPCDQYPTDGSVHRVESIDEYYDLGFTSKHPRGAYALKERTAGVKTVIQDVIWQTGKSGKVTPVAILEPINIDGATVSRATLNNPGFIEALGVEIGDSVFVERAGGIIPRIIRKAE